MSHKINILLVSFFLILQFIGCANNEDIKKVDLNKVEEMKGLPNESLRIRIGLVPEEDIRKMAQRYQPLVEYLSKKMNQKVILVFLDSYGEVCDKFIYKQLDAAFFGSFSYSLTHVKAGVEPIGRPDYNGVSTYRGLIVVRSDSNINSVSDMKGKKLALVHQATYAGYLYPLYYFKEHGIDSLQDYFSKVIFAGSHDKAIYALLRGEVDVAAPKDLVYQRIIKENPELEKKLIILSASGLVPSNTLCVRKDLGLALKDKLKETLLNLNNDQEAIPALEALSAARFIETKDSDYKNLYDTINALGIDLNTYPYYDRPDIGFGIEDYAKEHK
ncbi:MAG: hypothetical protein A2047_02200 [Omnitrophica bacterium GWA2_41_15]|nr:MAG: hypothetical protein A2047_02200 [Omnitrophica bacterium GWA2_41_15]HAZ10695.1 hypothetical protein [Candidatus Omnitrophota bacterium]